MLGTKLEEYYEIAAYLKGKKRVNLKASLILQISFHEFLAHKVPM